MRRIFLLAAALVAGVALGLPSAAVAAPAPSASAAVTPHGGGGQTITICFPVFVDPPGITVWSCFTIVVPYEVAPPGDGCPQCGEAIDLTYDPIDFKSVSTVVNELGQGYTLLGQAAVSTVKGEAAKLHDAAINEFTDVAKTLGKTRLGEQQVGYVDPVTSKFEPEPQPWRQEAATDLMKAVGNLQSYLTKANPQTLATATSQLDASFQVIGKNAAAPAAKAIG
jgi:hypothetical protein